MKKAFGKFSGDLKVLHRNGGELQGLDAAIVKATSYKHKLPKEKHIRST